ncbi:MAG: aldo/keto reductase [bacterium]|nr:aldo/keto reductase [bacterium]
MTPAGAGTAATAAFARAHGSLPPAHWRPLGPWTVSSLGIGTSLGAPDDDTDVRVVAAVVAAVRGGLNVVDTAIDYRAQHGERAVGRALRVLAAEHGVARDRLVVCTKGGFLPFDDFVPPDPQAWFEDAYVRPGRLAAGEIVAGHALDPAWIGDQLTHSLANLGLAAIDVYYVHDPETQLRARPRADVLARLEVVFARLEAEADAGRIGCYGVATWDGLRRPPADPAHLPLGTLVAAAERVAGRGHRFRVVQAPLSVAMPEALTTPTQDVGGRVCTLLEAAERLGLAVVASAPLQAGQLTRRLPGALGRALPGLDTFAQRALQFTRSAPGVATALVGMKDLAHVRENLAVAAVPPAPAGVDSLVGRG